MKLSELIEIAYPAPLDRHLRQRVDSIIDYFGDVDITAITHSSLKGLTLKFSEKGLKNATINRYLSVISKCATVYRKCFDPSYTLYIPWHKEGAGRLEWLKEQDETLVLSNLTPDIRLCVQTLLITGMRLGEFTSLELNQVDGDWIRLWKTKTNRPRSVPLPAGMGEQLRQLITRGVPKAHTIRRGLSAALRASGVNSRITPHSLRHTTATRLIKRGVNLLTTGRYLGHNSLKTTQRYVHLEDSDIRGAMDVMLS